MKLINNFLVLPNSSLDVEQLLIDSGRSIEEASKTVSITGISSICYAYPKLLTDFVFDGLNKINKINSEIFADIDAVIVVSQSYDQRIPSISTRIQNKFRLKNDTFCLDVMDGCSGYIKALSLASALEKKGHKKVLLIAGDINSMVTSEAEVGTRILFGDGISVSIFESDGFKMDIRLFNKGDSDNIISCSVSENIMVMNGFEVFRFTRNVVPMLINSYLEETGKSIQFYDLVGLHQASKLVVSTICSSIKFTNSLSNDFSCEEIGNLGAGSIGAWLSRIGDLDRKGKLNMLAVGYGSGLSWGLASFVVDVRRNEVVYV
jgi:3-oxoacyl-[acyl-carrier-protein] synthase-3